MSLNVKLKESGCQAISSYLTIMRRRMEPSILADRQASSQYLGDATLHRESVEQMIKF